MMRLKGGSRAAVYYAASTVAAVPIVLLLKQGEKWGGGGMAAVGTLVLVAAHAAFLWYWRGLDETARAAHKDGFFWGGLFGVYLIALAALVLKADPSLFPATAKSAGEVFTLGLGAATIAFVVSALAAWAIWWLRRR